MLTERVTGDIGEECTYVVTGDAAESLADGIFVDVFSADFAAECRFEVNYGTKKEDCQFCAKLFTRNIKASCRTGL